MRVPATPVPIAQILIQLVAAALLCLFGVSRANAAEGSPPATATHKTTQSESYIGIEPLYASILDGSRPRGLLMVEIGLDVPDSALRERVNQTLPALRDAYVRSLLTYAATSVRPWRQPSVEDIANRMQNITNHVIGREGAKVLMAQTAIRLTR
jgi:flagellar basal body-associated protein FliL